MTRGTLLLLALLLIEAGLAVVSVRSKSPQRRVRMTVRWVEFATFLVLLLGGVFAWGPRYCAVTSWLSVLAVGSTVAFRLGKGSDRRPRTWRLLAWATVVATLTALTVSPALVFPEYAPLAPTGEHGVGTSFATLTDNSRVDPYEDGTTPRRLNVGFWYPEPSGRSAGSSTFPLVVFSHGGTGIRTSNESLFTELASHGYVVASIDHPHHSLFTTDTDGTTVWIDRGYLDQLRIEDAKSRPEQSLRLYEEWMSIRMADIDFAIDHIVGSASRESPEGVYRLIDPEELVLAGHSLGGSAALGIGRTRDDVDAVIALESPFMADIVGVRDDDFEWEESPYPVPVLNIYSDSSWEHLDDWPQYARNHELLDAGSGRALSLHLTGVGHLGLTDLSLASPALTRLLDGRPAVDARATLAEINRVCLEFLSQLRGEG